MFFITNFIRIPIFIFLLALNTSFHGTLVSLCAPIKFAIPILFWRDQWSKISYWIAGGFVITNNFLLKLLFTLEWDIEGLDNLCKKGTYLVICNHLSLLDIPVAQGIFFRRIPFLRFFIKKELAWVPFLGQALLALEYPTMNRYSKNTLKKRPELRGKDLETAKKSSDKLLGKPVSILNYPEGTRFTKTKHSKYKSAYKNLLNPRAGGIHTVLSSLGNQLTAIINVTLVYPGHSSPKLIDFLLGKVKKIVVRIETIELGKKEIPSINTIRDKGGSVAIRNFLNKIWYEKDLLINKIHRENTDKLNINQQTNDPSSTDSVGESKTISLSSE